MSFLGRTVIGGVNVLVVGRAVGYLSQLAVTVILARLISVDAFGVVAICAAVVAFGQVLSSAGVGPALVQRTAVGQRHIDTAWTITLILSTAVLLIVWWTAPWVTEFFEISGSMGVYLLSCAALPLGALSSVPTALLQRKLAFGRLAHLELWSYLIGYGAPALILAYMGFGVWSLAGAMTCQALINLVAVTLFARRDGNLRVLVWSIDRTSARELLGFGVGYTVAAIAGYGSTQGDNLVVGRKFELADVGYYSKAYQLISLPAMLVGYALETVLFPVFSKIQNRRDLMASAYSAGISVMTVIFMPLSGALFLTAEPLVLVVLGPNWLPAVSLVRVLSVFVYVRMAYKLTDSVCRSLGVVNQQAVLKFVYALTVVSGAVLGSRYGLEAVAVAVGIAVLLNYILMNILVFRHLPLVLGEFLVPHLRGAVLAVVLAAAGSGVQVVLNSTLAWPPVGVLLGVWLYYALCLGALCYLLPAQLLGRQGATMLVASLPSIRMLAPLKRKLQSFEVPD